MHFQQEFFGVFIKTCCKKDRKCYYTIACVNVTYARKGSEFLIKIWKISFDKKMKSYVTLCNRSLHYIWFFCLICIFFWLRQVYNIDTQNNTISENAAIIAEAVLALAPWIWKQ